MRVLVTGAAGMLGTDVCRALKAAGEEPLPSDIVGEALRMDITNAAAVRETLEGLRPDAVIHCAAFTDVDGAERNPDSAYRVNALGSWTVAAACAELDIPLCAISTDFVFDGRKAGAYTEFDAPNPLSHYGASKLAGEQRVRELCRRHWIVRTAWLYGLHGKCFPNSILTAAETRPELRVVADQRGCPTCTADLAQTLIWILRSPLYGTYHVTNAGETTWYDFARRALELAGKSQVRVLPIPASEWLSPARRPANSVLRPLSLEMQGAPLPRPWEEALAEYVRERTKQAPRR